MVSNWEDCIVATRTKAGMFGVYARKETEVYIRGRYVRKWLTIDSVGGILTASNFVQAVRRCEVTICIDVYWPDAIEAIKTLDLVFSSAVEEEVNA